MKAFLCHASGDKPPVRDLYRRLVIEGVDAWLDQEKLLPGQDWRVEIPRVVQEADVVVICLSKKSVTKEGYVQKEIKDALDVADEKPEGTIFLIPARLEDCDVPERLSRWQWVDLFDENGFIKLLRSLKLRADKIGASVEPFGYASEDKEIESRLDQLYTEGLAAFYTDDWDRACQRFQTILSERPGHKAASEKLVEAERQRTLAKLYTRSTEMVRTEDWAAAIQSLEELLQKASDYKDAAQLLRNAKKQKQLRELYAEAKTLHAAQKWQAVVKVFEQITAIDPAFPDPDGLLPSAQQAVAELKRLAGLNDLYSRAVREMDAGQWQAARQLLEQVHKTQTGFLETERLLRKVEDEITKVEEHGRRGQQIDTLYEQAHGLIRSKNWRMTLDKIEEIQKLDDHFVDQDEIAKKAQAELAREEQEAQRQNELAALYAEAVRLVKEEKFPEALEKWLAIQAVDPNYPDRQGVQRTAKRKLAGVAEGVEFVTPAVSPNNLRIEWYILLAAIGFGFSILLGEDPGRLFPITVDIPPGLIWFLRGIVNGLIVFWALQKIVPGWKWKAGLTFAICWGILFPVFSQLFLGPYPHILKSMLYSLIPTLSILISSIWTRRVNSWVTYVLIFLGWVLASTIGGIVANNLRIPNFNWILGDFLSCGVGLWITVKLLQAETITPPVPDSFWARLKSVFLKPSSIATTETGVAKAIQRRADWSILFVAIFWGIGRSLIEVLARITIFSRLFNFDEAFWAAEIIVTTFGLLFGVAIWLMMGMWKIEMSWKKVIVLVGGWFLGFLVVAIIGYSSSHKFWDLGYLLAGLIAGFCTAFILSSLGILPKFKQVFWVAAGLAVSIVLGDKFNGVFWTMMDIIPVPIEYFYGIGSFIAGLFSACLLVNQLPWREEAIKKA